MTLEERLDRFLKKTPSVDSSAYIAKQATLIGSVYIGPLSSVWPGCVLRGDINSIEIGEGTNVQDGTVIHLADDYSVKIGDYVTIGHMAMLHACTIEDECMIGMHATLLDGCIIGKRSIIGANSLITKGTVIPPGSIVMGSPGKVVRTLDKLEQEAIRSQAEKYIVTANAHKKEFGMVQAIDN